MSRMNNLTRVLITAAAMLLVGALAFYLLAEVMPPFNVAATLTIDAANVNKSAQKDLDKGSDAATAFKRQLNMVRAGRSASGVSMTDLYVSIFGQEAVKCPDCDTRLPEGTDITQKQTCPKCGKTDIDLKADFQKEIDAVKATAVKENTEGTYGITYAYQHRDLNVAKAMVNGLVAEVEANILAQADKDFPETARGTDILGEAAQQANLGPRTWLVTALMMIFTGMIGYMILTRDVKNVAFRRLMAYTLLIILSFLCIVFFYIMVINTTRTHGDIQRGISLLPGRAFMDNYRSLMSMSELPVWRGMLNSLLVSSCVAILSTYFSVLTAYAIHAYDFRFRKFAFSFILLVMMIPTQVSALGFIEMMRDWNLMDNFLPLILPSIASPAVFFFMKQFMDSTLPLAIVEAARIDGSSEFGTFNRIVIHIMKPAIAVQAIFTFVSSWNNYFTPALLLKDAQMKTLPVLIAQLRSADYTKFNMGNVYMMICLSIAPVIIVYLCLSKFIIAGVAVGGVKE